MRRLTSMLSVIVLTVLSPLIGAAAAPRGAPVAPRLLPVELKPAAASKLDAALARAATAADPLEAARRAGFHVRDDRIQVYVIVEAGGAETMEAWLTARGALWISSFGDTVQAHVTVPTLEQLKQHPDVLAIRRPRYVQPSERERDRSTAIEAGVYTSEGVAAMNATAWHQAGFTGGGVKVGIIDPEFGGYQTLLGTELPAAERVHFRAFGASVVDPAAPHGTACAEIITDVAPSIDDLYLALIETGVDEANATQWMTSLGVNVVSESAGTAVGPGDGSGAPEVDSFVSSGGFFATSAGNERVQHWQGTWADADSSGYLDFASGFDVNYTSYLDGQLIWLEPGDPDISADLIWNQWYAPATDLDFYLVLWDGVSENADIVESSDDPQTGQPGEYPWEHLSHTIAAAGYYGLAIKHYSGPTDVDIEVFADPYPIAYRVAAGSVTHPADKASVVSVAALDAGYSYPLEPYSSAGPTNGPGGSLTGGITKPDIAGYANVSTASYGPRTPGLYSFNGTSAACPHVAGAAALVWSAHPDWTNTQVRSFLEGRAVDMGPAGKDNDYGYGRLDLGVPPQVCTYSLSPSAASVPASGGAGQFSVHTALSCSWTASPSVLWAIVTVGSSGQGDGSVSYQVAANPGPNPRTGTIVVGGESFTITQAGQASPCTYSLIPSGVNVTAEGGAATFSVSTSSSCSWTASPSVSWISITLGSTGTGSGTVSYQVAANPDTSPRTGSVNVAGVLFNVNQAGLSTCAYTLTPTQTDFPAEGGEAQVLVSVNDSSCSWTSASMVSWITIIENGSATGAKVLRFRVDPNTGGARSGDLRIAGKTLSITQAKYSSGNYRYLVAGVAHASGIGGSQWRTALGITNTSDRYVNLTFVYRSTAGMTTKTGSFGSHATSEFDDVALSFFGVQGSSSGAIEIRSDAPLHVSARTYNQTSSGTYGQFLPGCEIDEALSNGQRGILQHLKKTSSFRTNIGFVNFSSTACEVRVKLYSRSGVNLGSPIVRYIGPGEWKQENDVFSVAGVTSCDLGYAIVEVYTPDCSVWAYASIVDNLSGDPTTVPVMVE